MRRIRWTAALIALTLACGDGGVTEPRDASSPLVPPGPGGVLAIGTDATTGATLETNKDDYSPGEVVHLRGSGWAPNESINLQMSESPDTHGDVDTTVVADAQGAFDIHFYDVQVHDLGVFFTLVGTGATSGSRVTVAFTDGNIRFITSPASLVSAVTYSRYNGSGTCGGSPNNTGNSLTYGTALGLNDGQSILFPIPPVPGYNYSSVSSGGLTITEVAPGSLCVSGFGGGSQLTFTLNYTGSSIHTTTTVSAAPTPSVFGEPVTFTATVTPASGPAATGTVNFYEFTGVQSCVAPPATSLGTDAAAPFELTTSTLSTGSHTITACYVPNSGWAASVGTVVHTVNKANTTTTLSSAPDPSSAGEDVTFTATVAAVAPGAGTPGGTVTLYEFTGAQSCSAPGAATTLGSGSLVSGTATIGSVSGLAAQPTPHTITACYGGSTNYNASGGTDTHDVNKRATTTTITSSSNPSVTGETVTFTATVTSGASAASGSVFFAVGGTSCNDAAAFTSPIALNGSGEASATQAFPASQSTKTVRACYSGDPTYAVSEGSVVQVINPASVTVTVTTSGSPSIYGTLVTFTATIAVVAPGAGAPVGNITFHDGATCAATEIGSAAIAGAQAAISEDHLSATTHTITACYAGNADYSSDDGAVQQVVKRANATIVVTPYDVTYTGTSHTATGTATGVFGEPLTGLDLSGTTHTDAGDYPNDAWTFTDPTGNYNGANGTVHDKIARANAIISVTGYHVTYDANPHTATGTATGVQNEALSSLNLSGTTHTNAGTYTDSWSFTDVTGNYNNAGGTVTDIINRATPTIDWDNPADITWPAALSSTQLNAVVNGVNAAQSPLPGTKVYTPASGTVLLVGPNQALQVDFTPTDVTNYTTATKTVYINVVDKSAPIVSLTAANPNPAQVNTAISITANVSDVTTGNSNVTSACYSIDGGTCTAMSGTFGTPNVNVSASIAASSATDVFEVCVYGTDSYGNTNAKMDCVLVARYDPNAGFVTGGGWIISPAGALAANPALTGKANFGFVSKYQKGKTTPTGNTEFQFHAGSVNFSSSVYEWLVVSGARAQYKGTGTINGSGDYGFLLTAIDGQLNGGGGTDKFRIKIWNRGTGAIVYDNNMGASDTGDPTTVIGSGSIVIHAK